MSMQPPDPNHGRSVTSPSTPHASAPCTLNEAVNFEMQCIFIAVPKTGTTAVRAQLAPQGTPLIPNAHLNIMQVRDSLYVFFLKQALGHNHSFPTEAVPADAEIRGHARHVFHAYFKFAAVRNPWARAVSLYCRREGVHVKDTLSFEAFCRQHLHASDTCLHPTLHQNQFDWLCDEHGLSIMDYVYRLEDLGQAVKEIAERTNGRIKLVDRSMNVNPASGARHYRDLYTEETRSIIASRFEKDIDYFKYAF